MNSLRHLLSSTPFKILLSIALLTFLFWKTDVGELKAAVLEADPAWMLLALSTYIFSQVISAVRWCMLARPLGFNEPWTRFFTFYFTGMYMNLFAPSTVAGDIGRALFLAHGKKTRALAVASVIADRGLGFVVLVWIAAIAVLLVDDYPVPAPLHVVAWLAFPAMIAAWWWGPLLMVRFLAPSNKWRLLVERQLAPYRNDPSVLIPSSLIALFFHILQISSQVFVARALEMTVPWPFFFVFVPVVNIVGMAPISFSGIGIREASYTYLLGLAMVDSHTSVALGLLASTIVLLNGLAGLPSFLVMQRSGEVEAAEHDVESDPDA